MNESLTSEYVETPGPQHSLHDKSEETNRTPEPDSYEDFSEEFEMVNMGDSCREEDDEVKDLETLLEELEQDYDSWVELRRKTVVNLREIADYIDSVSKKSGLAKVQLNFESVKNYAGFFRFINSAIFTLGHWQWGWHRRRGSNPDRWCTDYCLCGRSSAHTAGGNGARSSIGSRGWRCSCNRKSHQVTADESSKECH